MKPEKLQESAQSPTPVANATQENTETLHNITQKAFNFCIDNSFKLYNPKPEVLFKTIREHLGDVVAKQIESLPPTGLRLLVVGGKGGLARDVVSYLCYFHNKKSVRFVDDLADRGITFQIPNTNTFVPLFQPFYTLDIFPIEYINCGVKTENVLMDNLNALISAEGKAPRYLSLFLNNLNPEYRRIFEWLAEMERNQTTFYPTMLIVSVKKADNLPDGFSRQFKVIELGAANPNGQATLEPHNTASTPQTPAGEPGNEPQSATQKQGNTKDVICFPTPAGTQWNEVVISFDDTENVTISTKTKTEKKHYFDMGFRKGKSSKPVASWFVLKVFSEEGCLKYTETGKTKTEKSIQDLRKRLIAIFGILGDPITLKDGYRPVFKCCTNESRSRSVKAFSNSKVLNDDNKDDD